MKKFYFLLFALLILQQAVLAQDYSRAWVKTDSTHADEPSVSITDKYGNTYLATLIIKAQNYFDKLSLEKINKYGKLEWQSYFKDTTYPSYRFILPKAITISPSGDIYLSVAINDGIYPIKMQTFKYNSSGDLQWRNKFYDGHGVAALPINIYFTPDNFIQVVGYRERDTIYQILFQKINVNGQTKSVQRFKIENSFINASSLDKKGNIFIAGTNYSEEKPVIWKFNKDGLLQWTNTFNKEGRQFRSIQCDDYGDAYAYASDVFNSSDGFVVKYNAAGDERWFVRNKIQGAYAVNAAGNLWLSNNWTITKYSNTGIQLWTSTFTDSSVNSYEGIYKIVSDSDENIFCGGQIAYKYRSLASVIVGFDKNGTQIFKDKYDNDRYVGFVNLTLDSSGNLYAVNNKDVYPANSIYYESYIFIKYKKTNQPFALKALPKTENYFKLYPNPAANNISIDFTTSSSIKNYKLMISDVSGNIVLVKQLNADKTIHLNVDVSNLKTGVYTLNISDGVSNVSKTFLKQ